MEDLVDTINTIRYTQNGFLDGQNNPLETFLFIDNGKASVLLYKDIKGDPIHELPVQVLHPETHIATTLFYQNEICLEVSFHLSQQDIDSYQYWIQADKLG